MKLHNARQTINQRTLAFLQEAYHEIVRKKDDELRMTFTATKHYLTPAPVISAAQSLGLIKRFGWKWEWTGRKPDMKVTLAVREAAQSFYANSRTPRAHRTRQRGKLRRA